MSVSGIVITFGTDADLAQSARHAIQAEGWLELGELHGVRLPAVVDAPSDRTARELVTRLGELPGVTSVDVVFVGIDDDRGATPPDSSAKPPLRTGG